MSAHSHQAFHSLLALLPKGYDQLCTAMWLLRHFLLLIILYHQFKLNYHVSIFENMGVILAGPHSNYGRGCA